MTELNLYGCEIGEQGAKYIAEVLINKQVSIHHLLQ
jgi:hypothetical protein